MRPILVSERTSSGPLTTFTPCAWLSTKKALERLALQRVAMEPIALEPIALPAQVGLLLRPVMLLVLMLVLVLLWLVTALLRLEPQRSPLRGMLV